MRERTPCTASYAGLTRLRGRSPFGAAKACVSITLRKSLSKNMDGRVKPGHDEKPAHICAPQAVNPRKNP
jgi:hypothetical protein